MRSRAIPGVSTADDSVVGQCRMEELDWLLDSDPAIRWQAMRDLQSRPADEVRTERAKIATEGWGARLLGLQGDDGYWANGAYFPADTSNLERGPDGRLLGQPWTATVWSLTLLRLFGLDPDSPEAERAIDLVNENVRWEYAGEPFFEGEVEPCVNGVTTALGSYFAVDVSRLVERLLGEQMDDGGWNCEQENGSTRGSFHTTIAVLEGLAEFEERNGRSTNIQTARERGEEYLLDRHLMNRLSDGQMISQSWTQFAFPTWWHYDVLRGLDHMRRTRSADERMDRALDIVEGHRRADGRWNRQRVYSGAIHFDIDRPEGEPGRWITLRALRVLKWAKRL